MNSFFWGKKRNTLWIVTKPDRIKRPKKCRFCAGKSRLLEKAARAPVIFQKFKAVRLPKKTNLGRLSKTQTAQGATDQGVPFSKRHPWAVPVSPWGKFSRRRRCLFQKGTLRRLALFSSRGGGCLFHFLAGLSLLFFFLFWSTRISSHTTHVSQDRH